MTSYQDSRKSPKDYFKWRIKRARPVVEKLNKIKKLKGLKVLEVGCGYGSLASLLLDKGATVVGTEADKVSLQNAKELLHGRRNLKLLAVKSERLPLAAESFDVVVLFDAIEHVRRPKAMIAECLRVLKPGGILYVEFTPYYSLTGHHLYDVTKLPIHILPETYLKKIVFNHKFGSFFGAAEAWRTFKSLNKLRISEFQRSVRNLTPIEERYIFKYPDVFEVNLKFLSLFGNFKDILTLSFEGIYRKG